MFKFVIVMTFALLSVGCATTDKPNSPTNFSWPDHHFPDFADTEIVDVDAIFAIDQSMQQWVDKHLHPLTDTHDKINFLVDHLHKNAGQAGVLYDLQANYTATQSFHLNRANCLSLTILAYVLANHAGLNSQFQQIAVPEYWSQVNGYSVLTGHVNLRIEQQPLATHSQEPYNNDVFEVDFDPYAVRWHFRKSLIEQSTIIAMFYNNLAGKMLVEQQPQRAYAFLKRALTIDPEYDAAWLNLAVLLKQTQLLAESEQAYLVALSLNSRSATIKENLAILYRQTGREKQAKKLLLSIEQQRQNNPYYFSMLAGQAFHKGDLVLAKKHYLQAISMRRNEHEFYYGLARVYARLGDVEQSKQQLKKAIQYNEFNQLSQRYRAKLARLDQLTTIN